MNADDTTSRELKELVERFRVCWKAWPEYTYVDGKRRQIGFDLDLSGTHEPWVKHPDPGCEHCQRVFAGLRQIAEWVLPKEERLSKYEIEPFDQSIRYTRTHKNRPDVQLAISIAHRGVWEEPVDECEERCLKEMEERLRDLGASEGSWMEHRRQQNGSGA